MFNRKRIVINFLLFPFLLIPFYLNGQNLVQDSSFEIYRNCPHETGQFSELAYWWSPTYGTPDLYCGCISDKKKQWTNVPDNVSGYQNAHSGNCYAGFIAYSPSTPNFREYIQTKLTGQLEAGKKYCFNLFYSVSDYDYYIIDSTIGAYFSADKIDIHNSDILNVIPQIKNTVSLKNDRKEWFSFCGVFLAKGGEEYITIGAFKVKKSKSNKKRIPLPTKYRSVPSDYLPEAYYFVDDISLKEVSDSASCSCGSNLDKSVPINFHDTISIGKSSLFFNKEYPIHGLVFSSNSFKIKRTEYQSLDSLIFTMKEYPELRMEIHGHTDAVGNEVNNLELSANRAKAVVDYLISKGISEERLSYKGFGSSKPIDTNETEQGRANNRRVEFVILQK